MNSVERVALDAELRAQGQPIAGLRMRIGSDWRLGSGRRRRIVQPHAHQEAVGIVGAASHADAQAAIAAAMDAAPTWASLPFDARAAIFLKAADLLAGPWRAKLNAATMLGQSKTMHQAEIDSACELIDFWRFNVHFASQVLAEQPLANAPGVWNRLDHRPLEGFIYAITPFNFTAIAGNLPTAPALMGNVVIWKPATSQLLAAELTMQVLQAAGLPAGVINLVTGEGPAISEVVLRHPLLAGVHFTGSTAVFQNIWQTVGQRIATYRTYPRLVGETGGKDFVLAHPSADVDELATALIRGAFEYQGQKCSAASRAYIPRSMWARMRTGLIDQVKDIRVGDVREPTNFMGAVIDERAFNRLKGAIDRARVTPSVTVAAGGSCSDINGWFVSPTILEGSDPTDEIFTTEYFGPILSVYAYDDWEQVLPLVDSASPYALTGAIFARDRQAVVSATEALRHTAGNFYINDKPTGAVVGQQPFGGGRASGTNDKAGGRQNLQRWVSTRAIKETFVPATDYHYPSMA